ncbi:MAG: dienelactone hydrolase family protein [Acidobacteria bacterium]|nr:dienelactone hydrolase family protein [Acidobacteriota bacterium]
MLISSEFVNVPAGSGAMRAYVAMPKRDGRFPGILCYSDIFQLTPSTLRSCARLAGYGYVVVAPEIYHRIEPPGTALEFDDAGRDRGLADAARTPVAHFDEDARFALDFLATHPRVAKEQLGVAGWCIGGHLAFRAALQPDVRAAACFYATGVHNGKLGADEDSRSLMRSGEIAAELMMVWGTSDPHIPAPDRIAIRKALHDAGVSCVFHEFPAEHAFMRDVGPRYDAEATDEAHALLVSHFRRYLG